MLFRSVFDLEVKLTNTGSLTGFGVELVIHNIDEDNTQEVKSVEFEQVKTEPDALFYRLPYKATRAGSFSYALRIYPKHADLPHRQDLCLVKWFY